MNAHNVKKQLSTRGQMMMQQSAFALFKKIILASILGIFIYLCWLMLKICMSYFPWSSTQGFLVLKQDIVNFALWQWAFKIHVAASSLVLLAGFTQFWPYLRQQHTQWHRRCGWLYIITVLGLAGPSGLILALYAAGGFITQLCFGLLSSVWMLCTLYALRAAMQRKWLLHRDWMIRSFTLSLSALSLRTWKLGLYELAPYVDWLTPKTIYQLEAWLGWLVNLLIAELIIYYLYQRHAATQNINIRQ